MAKGVILLPLEFAVVPSGGSDNEPAVLSLYESGGSPGTNTPKVTQTVYNFDDTQDEHIMWSFLMPDNIVGGGVLRTKFRMASATTGAVRLKAQKSSVEDGVDDDTAAAFPFATGVTVVVPGTVGLIAEALLSIGYGLAGMKHVIFFGRDADHGADTATGDMILVAASYEYTPS